MLENMENTLFNTNVHALVIAFNNMHYNENVDFEVSINIVMEESLRRVTQLSSTIVSSSIASFKCLTRKK